MSFLDDIRKGRELQQKKTISRTQYTRKPKPSGIAVEIGKFIEFANGLISKRGKPDGVGDISGGVLKKYSEIVKQDLSAIMERLCGLVPKKKPKYDPLDAAWRRGRGGS